MREGRGACRYRFVFSDYLMKKTFVKRQCDTVESQSSIIGELTVVCTSLSCARNRVLNKNRGIKVPVYCVSFIVYIESKRDFRKK